MTGVDGLVRSTSPFFDLKRAASDVVWLEPRLVADISYSELMEDRLRDPVLRELGSSEALPLYLPFRGRRRTLSRERDSRRQILGFRRQALTEVWAPFYHSPRVA